MLCLTLAGFAFLVGVLPGRTTDAAKLRARYVRSLSSYEGTRYVWGGENLLGIDCSGLVRRGLINASFTEGIVTANPGLIREAFALRWFDCSANALRQEYRHQTRRTLSVRSIRQLDHTKLQPGDFAITADGVHALAYLGNEVWIEADPAVGRVIKLRASEDSPWLNQQVEVMRWRVLEMREPKQR
jgi:cell wall-associated NlpC family hydrolase